jgi:phage tail sheath protein FI
MPANFLHGVETIEVTKGARTIRGVKTAVIGLIGSAPIWEVDAANQKVNVPVLITSAQDAEKYFGTVRTGYTIPQALKAIFDQGRGIAIVVNVFDPAVQKTAVALADHTFDADELITLADQGVRAVIVKNGAGTVTYVLNTDYSLDAVTGVITRKVGGAIAAGATVKVGYDKPNPAALVSADIVGAVNGGGNRTGIEALDDSFNLFGFWPKILIAPAFCTQVSVTAALVVKAGKLRADAIVDAPIGTTRDDVIAGRGPDGTINFDSSSNRLLLCYPHLLVSDGNGGTVLEPYSQRLAGVIAALDDEKGFHWSPSNREILGIVGVERRLSAMVNDSNSDVNALNEVGIITVFNSFGTGYRTWGNRSAAWPTSTDPLNLINIRRTADILHESVELAMLQFIDQPINDALIDAIKDSVSGFIRVLIGRGALVGGSCTYDPADNSVEEIEAGHLTFGLTFMPPTPAERITFKSFIDINLLSALAATA